MRNGLVPGTAAEVVLTVTDAMTVRFDELGPTHPVYATWMMIKHMEEAGRKVILPFLDDGEDAVGYAVDVVHVAPTPVGGRVRARAVLERVEGRRIHCRVEAHNEREKIGEGRTVQVVVPRGRLEARFRDSVARPAASPRAGEGGSHVD
ncbi:MAG TPA: thioesterase family protein [bacterium]|nr:thioesterase family protein [bacterium]